MQGYDFCYLHNPVVGLKTKQEARARGGRKNGAHVSNPLPAMKLHSPQNVVLLLEDTINRVRDGEMDLKAANCLGYLAGHLAKAIELSVMEVRIRELEEVFSAGGGKNLTGS